MEDPLTNRGRTAGREPTKRRSRVWFAARPILTLRALWQFLTFDLAFRRSSFQELYQSVIRRAGRYPMEPAHPAHDDSVEKTLAAVQTSTRYYYRDRKDCLPKSFVLYTLLRSQRIPADLVIAVRKYPFAAHAWVEYRGVALGETAESIKEFKVLSRV